MEKLRFRAALLHPRYWLTWLLFAFWFLLAQLPYRWQLAMGRGLGRLMLRLAPSRRTIAERNLALCFPELGEVERQELLRRNFESSGIALMETGMAWFRPLPWLRKRFQMEGLEQLKEIQSQGVVSY